MSQVGVSAVYSGGVAFADSQTNSKSDQSLVAAVTGYAIVVDLIVVSATAACTFFLESGTSTTIFPVCSLAAGTTLVIPDPKTRTAASAALTWTNTITGNFSIYVKYHLEG